MGQSGLLLFTGLSLIFVRGAGQNLREMPSRTTAPSIERKNQYSNRVLRLPEMADATVFINNGDYF